jgi:hypothetical protein
MVWYDNEWGYSNRLVELTADIGKLLHNDSPPPAGGTGPQEKQLEAPSPEDFLPAPDPLGQEAGELAHNTTEEHSPVEGVPGAETPADTAPQQGQSAVSPESQAGPDKPHEF